MFLEIETYFLIVLNVVLVKKYLLGRGFWLCGPQFADPCTNDLIII